MKNLLIIFLAFFLAACSQTPENSNLVRISGTIENAGDQPVEFVFYRDYTNNHKEIITLEPGADNQFTVEFEMKEPAMGTLRHGRTSIRLFLEPGDELVLNADAASLLESLALEGPAAASNNFLLAYQREVEPGYSQSFFNNAAKDHDAVAFVALMDEVTAKKLESLEKHPQAEELSEAFKHHFVTEVHYDKYNRLLGYAASHQRFNQLEEPTALPAGYYDFLDQAIHADVKCLNSETCAAFLMAYLNHQAALQPDRFDEQASPNETGYLLAKENLTGPASEYVQLINISREFNYGDLDKATAMYQEFMANSQVPDYRERMTNTWNSIQLMMPGNPAPEFTMTDMDGNTVSLSDYRGKVVFLKFWASWCGPCMRQVPPAAELKERMAGQEDLVFLYVSIDTDSDAWRSTIERHNIKGVHMNTPGRERGVPALYQVKWIPTFYIIGRDGNIFHNRPPQPSDEDVDRVLMEALAQEV